MYMYYVYQDSVLFASSSSYMWGGTIYSHVENTCVTCYFSPDLSILTQNKINTLKFLWNIKNICKNVYNICINTTYLALFYKSQCMCSPVWFNHFVISLNCTGYPRYAKLNIVRSDKVDMLYRPMYLIQQFKKVVKFEGKKCQ